MLTYSSDFKLSYALYAGDIKTNCSRINFSGNNSGNLLCPYVNETAFTLQEEVRRLLQRRGSAQINGSGQAVETYIRTSEFTTIWNYFTTLWGGHKDRPVLGGKSESSNSAVIHVKPNRWFLMF